MLGLHLNFLQLKITFLLMHATRATREGGGGGSTTTKGEVSVGQGFGVAAALKCPNLSSPWRMIINY